MSSITFGDWVDLGAGVPDPSVEYIWLFDNGNMVIGREQIPGRIYWANGQYEPIERFTHYMLKPEPPNKNAPVNEDSGGS